jgi:hypothetical protein
MATVEWKRSIYERYRSTLPVEKQSDTYFKVFYSDIRPSKLLIVGINPGGDPLDPPHDAASLLYEKGEHDYADCGYRLALKMTEFLKGSGIVRSTDAIRTIPKINVIFERSASFDALADPEGAATRSAPFVREIVEAVKPKLLLFEGVKAFDIFRRFVLVEPPAPPDGRFPGLVQWFRFERHPGDHVVLPHPTSFHWRAEDWRAAMDEVGSMYATV